MYLPYVLLLASITAAPLPKPAAALTLLLSAVVAGLTTGALTPWALPGLALMLALSRRAHRGAIYGAAAFGFAEVLSNYLWPGFRNLRVFDQVHFTADAAPFSMFLNFDKTAAGLLLYLFAIDRPAWRDRRVIVGAWAAVTVALMGLSLWTGYVRFDVKWPDGGAWWALNNLFFVCLAEEAVFRGVMQARLEPWLGRAPAIALAAVAFGLQHYRGGPPYMALAAVAGLFYGYAYARTRRLEAAMLVHFGLNLTHFIFFTYPSL